jgi:hypothetical protein
MTLEAFPMFFLRLTLYTLGFYLAIALPIIAVELVIEFWGNGSFGITFQGRGAIAAFAGFWGIVWLTSFLLAFRRVFPFIWSRLIG